jgi:hypothetical protein
MGLCGFNRERRRIKKIRRRKAKGVNKNVSKPKRKRSRSGVVRDS